MKKYLVPVGLVVSGLFVFSGPVFATDSNMCPDGPSSKIDDLSGETYTVPSVDGFTVFGLSVKAGPDEIYIDVVEGQTVNVKELMGHDVSHVHLCKTQDEEETTQTTEAEEVTETTEAEEEEPTPTTDVSVDTTLETIVVTDTTDAPDTVPPTTDEPVVVVPTTDAPEVVVTTTQAPVPVVVVTSSVPVIIDTPSTEETTPSTSISPTPTATSVVPTPGAPATTISSPTSTGKSSTSVPTGPTAPDTSIPNDAQVIQDGPDRLANTGTNWLVMTLAIAAGLVGLGLLANTWRKQGNNEYDDKYDEGEYL